MAKELLTLQEYQCLQLKEMLGSDNRWYAGERLNRSPTDHEAIWHYIHNGGPEGFAELHSHGHREG